MKSHQLNKASHNKLIASLAIKRLITLVQKQAICNFILMRNVFQKHNLR